MTAGSIVRVPRPEALPPADRRLVVVEASAGTGKTFFLEHRVADLVLGGAELAQILLVTFTDKAVAELRMRIRDLLDRLSRAETSSDAASCWELDDAARARLRAAVIAFDHAPIFTIHAFCNRVLIEDAFAARRLFEQTQVADDVAFDAAFGALLRERFACTSPDRELLATYLAHGGTVDKLRTLLLACARSGAEPRVALDLDRALAAATALRQLAGTQAQRDELLAALPWKAQRNRAPGWMDELGEGLARWDGTAIGAVGLCTELRDRAETLEKYAVTRPPFAAALAEIGKVITLDEAIVIELLPHVLARIERDKAERGMFDYDDMLKLVRDALHGPRGPELADRLRTRTPWVMIDEFQDTDAVQWDIFRTVWLHESARGLTIVGDPKQAIYGFRGADVTTYMAARDELLALGAHRVSLATNRRSTAALVEAVNALMTQPLGELLDKSIRYEEPVAPAGEIECDDPRPPITVLAVEPPSAEPARSALAVAIGEEIDRLRRHPPVWRSRGRERPFALGDVMVLTRSNKESSAIGAALRARGLACALVESDRLFETREAAELAAVLDAIAAPRDRSARMRALRTRFFDVPWTELMRVVDAPDHHPAIARLFDWSALANKREYETLFRRIVEDSRFAERALVVGGGERAIVNTWHLVELLLEEVARSRSDLHELVAQLRRWIGEHEDLADDRDVQRAETDADAIRILTIHKAKGLEAPYVFLYGAASKPRSSSIHTLHDATGRALVVGSPEALAQRIEDEEAGENQRLAYVALTRAQVRLYLPRYAEKACDKRSTYMQIQRCLVPLLERAHAAFEVVAVEPVEDPPAPDGALVDFDPPPPPPPVELAPIDPARAGYAMLSYTRLRDAEKFVEAHARAAPVIEVQRAEFDVERVVGDAVEDRVLPEGELPPGADAGLFLHDLFEHVDIAAAAREADPEAWRAEPAVATLFADHARERGIAEACFAHAARLVHGTLTRPLVLTDGRELPPLAQATALAREMEFAFPVPGATGAPPRAIVKGFIDALVAWDDDLWVLDYKSDLLEDPARAGDHAREHYGVQARLYALATARMRGERTLKGLLFAFVRHGIVVPWPVSDELLATWTTWLGGVA